MDALIGAMRRKTYARQEVVAAEGEMDDAFFIIESGEAQIRKGEVRAGCPLTLSQTVTSTYLNGRHHLPYTCPGGIIVPHTAPHSTHIAPHRGPSRARWRPNTNPNSRPHPGIQIERGGDARPGGLLRRAGFGPSGRDQESQAKDECHLPWPYSAGCPLPECRRFAHRRES